MRKLFVIATAALAIAAVSVDVRSPAQGQPYGPGGYGPGYGMMGGDGYGMMGGGYGLGWMMRGYGPGQGMMWGYGGDYSASQTDLKLSADDVKKYLERMIRNPNLKVGEVKEKDADTISAEVVTKEKDVVVQRFSFNRHNGFYRTED
ncbi:MAG TPA: hypothetical protein VHD14_03030 [Pseudolabrys sp.]|nr:hypothetical protein [Pseudolabrys sp.]